MKLNYFILLILLSGCMSSKKTATPDQSNTINTVTESKIIFLNYKGTKDLNNTIKVNLISKILTEGRLKKNSFNSSIKTNDDFVCTQLDKELKPVDSIQISNPFIKTFEYFEPSGAMGKKTIELDSVEFSVRLQLKPNTKFISLKQLNSNATLLNIQL